MKLVLSILVAGCLFAGVDGKWSFETKQKAGKKGGAERTLTTTFELKTAGDQLTGSVHSSAGRRGRSAQITEGKIEGAKFSFTTVERTKKAEVKSRWTGSLEGDTLRGTCTREGKRRGQPFTAKRL